jgi:hypothetical protein
MPFVNQGGVELVQGDLYPMPVDVFLADVEDTIYQRYAVFLCHSL